MSLTQILRDQAYDLIDGPVRNHKTLQLWLKKNLDKIERYYDHVSHAISSDVELQETEAPALSVNASTKDEYSFNVGITILEDVLKSLGLGSLELSAKIKQGRSVAISYDNAVTRGVPTGKIAEYLSAGDFNHSNRPLLDNLNKNDVIIITDAIFAKNLVVAVETSYEISAELIAELNNVGSGKLDFSASGTHTIKMVSADGIPFPIAVKASRMQYRNGKFVDLKLVTDNRDFF